jgi:hypothetical protein
VEKMTVPPPNGVEKPPLRGVFPFAFQVAWLTSTVLCDPARENTTVSPTLIVNDAGLKVKPELMTVYVVACVAGVDIIVNSTASNKTLFMERSVYMKPAQLSNVVGPAQ